MLQEPGGRARISVADARPNAQSPMPALVIAEMHIGERLGGQAQDAHARIPHPQAHGGANEDLGNVELAGHHCVIAARRRCERKTRIEGQRPFKEIVGLIVWRGLPIERLPQDVACLGLNDQSPTRAGRMLRPREAR